MKQTFCRSIDYPGGVVVYTNYRAWVDDLIGSAHSHARRTGIYGAELWCCAWMEATRNRLIIIDATRGAHRCGTTHFAGCECHEAGRDAEINRLGAALVEMVRQYAYEARGMDYHAGGSAALEAAFAALGLPDLCEAADIDAAAARFGGQT